MKQLYLDFPQESKISYQLHTLCWHNFLLKELSIDSKPNCFSAMKQTKEYLINSKKKIKK